MKYSIETVNDISFECFELETDYNEDDIERYLCRYKQTTEGFKRIDRPIPEQLASDCYSKELVDKCHEFFQSVNPEIMMNISKIGREHTYD